MYKVLSLAFLATMVGCNQVALFDEQAYLADATKAGGGTNATKSDVIAYIKALDAENKNLRAQLAKCGGGDPSVSANIDSKILTSPEGKANFAAMVGGRKLELLYRASRDGWDSTYFHQKCDNQGETLTIISTIRGVVLGGYTDIPWSSPAGGQHVRKAGNKKSFLFKQSVSSQTFEVFKFTGAASNKEVLEGSKMMTWWEWGLMMYGNCNQGTTNSYISTKNYEVPHGMSGEQAKKYLNEGYVKVICMEFETFRVV